MNSILTREKIEKTLHFNSKMKEKTSRYSKKRYIFSEILAEAKQKHISGISGLRGMGKTIILGQLSEELKNSFYISCDTLEDIDLYKAIEYLVDNYKVRYILLDEIHFYKGWQKVLKLAYDFLDIKIFFTSSVSLDILQTEHDLARRVKITNVDFLSFREYLYLKHQIELPELSFEEILNNHQKLFLEQYDKEGYFREYLRNNITFMLEDNSTQLLKQIANKIIERDLFYYGDFNSDDIENLKNTIRFIANVPISDINYSSISSNIGVTKYKAKLYLDYLQKGYLLQSIMPYSSSVIKEPKVVLNIPFREYLSDRLPESQLYGAIREESFVQMISKIPSLQLFYLKSQRGARTPDYLVIYKGKKIIFEVGGKGKSFKQFKGIDKEFDRYTVNYPGITSENKIPLLLFGFME